MLSWISVRSMPLLFTIPETVRELKFHPFRLQCPSEAPGEEKQADGECLRQRAGHHFRVFFASFRFCKMVSVPPSLSEQRVVLTEKKTSDTAFIGNQYKGGLTQEMAFENRAPDLFRISYQLQSQAIPDTTSVLLPINKVEMAEKRYCHRGGKSVEYRLIGS